MPTSPKQRKDGKVVYIPKSEREASESGKVGRGAGDFRNDSTILPKGDERIKERFRMVIAELNTNSTRQALNFAWKTPMKYYRTHSVNQAVEEFKKRQRDVTK